jgi:hypothetical protein
VTREEPGVRRRPGGSAGPTRQARDDQLAQDGSRADPNPPSSPPHLTPLQHCTYRTPLHRVSGKDMSIHRAQRLSADHYLVQACAYKPLHSCPRPVANTRKTQPNPPAASSRLHAPALGQCDETLFGSTEKPLRSTPIVTTAGLLLRSADSCTTPDWDDCTFGHSRIPLTEQTQRHNMALVLAYG